MAKKPNFIQQRREELDITQEQMAAKLQAEGIEISRTTVTNWEKVGISHTKLREAEFRRALAKVLRMSVRDLLDELGFEVDEPEHSEEAERAAFIIDRLPRDKRNLALGILEKFLETN